MNFDIPSLSAAVAAFFVAIVSVGLRGFQHKSIAANQYKQMAMFCYLIVLADALSVLFVVKQGILITVPAGLGAVVGILSSTYAHNRWFNKKENHATR